MADKELRKVIGNRAKERRLELGLSGQDIADCLGVNKSTILRYERGTIDNEKKIIIEGLADALHVSVAWLKGETEEKETVITDNRDYLIKSVFEQISGSLTFDLGNKDSDFSKDVLLLLLKCYKEFSVSFERACNQYGDNADNEEIAKTIGCEDGNEFNHMMFQREIQHSINTIHAVSEIINGYSDNDKVARNRISAILREYPD